jgi:hypothetical protein
MKAAQAAQDLITLYRRGGKLEINEGLYKEQRLSFLRAFYNKCGYCEVVITAADHLGDIEHYRPKKRITDEKGNLVFIDAGQTRLHPGYFWLAYQWNNLFPACVACNRPGRDPDGVKSGKWDCFPVAGIRALNPGEENRENPVLLNPWQDDPEDHLTFDDDLGVLGSKTERGRDTIRILGLNRDGLVELRKNAVRLARMDFWESQQAFQRGDAIRYAEYKVNIGKYLSGASQFSAVCSAAIRKEKNRAEQYLNQLEA